MNGRTLKIVSTMILTLPKSKIKTATGMAYKQKIATIIPLEAYTKANYAS